MSRRILVVTLVFAIGLVAVPTAAAEPQTAPDLVGVGGACKATVHLSCSHVTAPDTCHVYVGGPDGACLVYGGDPVVGKGGECTATVHVACDHYTAPNRCAVYVGGQDGACILY